MTDREKVVKQFMHLLNAAKGNYQDFVDLTVDLGEEIAALLKEQEAVEPYSMNAERTYGICPQCGKIIFRYGNVEENHYCGVCGKAVKWDEI